MSGQPHYTAYHPKWYRRPVSVWWWLERWPYTKFVLRELTSLPVGYFALLTLWQVRALVEGEAAYNRFLTRLESPAFVMLNIICFAGVLFHAFTWFHLTPKAMVVRIFGKRLPDAFIIFLNYVGWIGLSAGIVLIWMRG